jgi:hypothetical protein
MRNSLYILAGFAVSACGAEGQHPITAESLVDGSLRYQVTTQAGAPLLTGRLVIDILEDSTIVGTWSTHWVSGADTTVEVGDQVGSGTLAGRQTEDGAHIDLNPGYADNNVILLAAPAEKGFAGTWYWSTIAGPRTGGRFTAVRD